MKSELCLTKSAIAPDGPAPEIGDPVSVELTGTIDRIEDDKYYLKDARANGVELPVETEPAEPDADDMRGMAEAMDARGLKEDSL